MSSYADRHLIFAKTTTSQKLSFAAFLVECVCDGDVEDKDRDELTRAHGTLRRLQGVFSKKEKLQK